MWSEATMDPQTSGVVGAAMVMNIGSEEAEIVLWMRPEVAVVTSTVESSAQLVVIVVGTDVLEALVVYVTQLDQSTVGVVGAVAVEEAVCLAELMVSRVTGSDTAIPCTSGVVGAAVVVESVGCKGVALFVNLMTWSAVGGVSGAADVFTAAVVAFLVASSKSVALPSEKQRFRK